MKAILLAGGEGTRLRPISAETAKPMVTLMDKPIMQYGVELLRRHGFDEITATLQTRPGQITDYFGDGGEFGVTMRYQTEHTPLGTAGGVRACYSHLDPHAPFIVMSGDAICDFDLTEALRFHNRKGADATLLLYTADQPLEYGVVMTDDMGRILRFIEKPGWEQVFANTINTGVYILSPEVLKLVPENSFFDFAHDLFPLMLSRGMNLFGVVAEGYWCDVGEPNAYLRCCRDLLDGRAKLELPPQDAPPPGAAMPCYIGQDCRIEPDAVIGAYSILCRGTGLGRRARVENCVLDGCAVGDMASVEGAYIGRRTQLREGVAVREGAVVGSDCVVGAHAELLGSARIWPRKEIEPQSRFGGSLTVGQSRAGARFEHSTLRGAPHVELTPEFLLRLADAMVQVMGGEVALSWQGGDAARLAALALETGLCAAGGSPVLTDALFPAAGAYAAGLYRFPVTVFVRQKDDHLCLHFFDADGLPLTRDTQRKIEALTARGECRLADTRGAGHSRLIHGIADAHTGAAAAAPGWYTGGSLRAGLIVQVGGGDAAAASLAQALLAAGCRVQTVGTPRPGTPYFAADEDGLRLSAVDEGGQTLSPGRLTAMLLWLEAQAGARQLALPYTAPAGLDELAARLSMTVLRLGRDGTAARELYARQRFVRDALFGAARLCYGLRKTGLSLRDLAARVPAFHESSQVVGVEGDRGEIMRELAGRHRDAELVEGFRVRLGAGWVHVAPLTTRRALRVTAEGASAEIAAELCDSFADAMKEIDGRRGD